MTADQIILAAVRKDFAATAAEPHLLQSALETAIVAKYQVEIDRSAVEIEVATEKKPQRDLGRWEIQID